MPSAPCGDYIPIKEYVKRKAARRWTLCLANIAQTIPSLALFGFLVPLPLIGGIGKRTAIVALCLYAVLPIRTDAVASILGRAEILAGLALLGAWL